MSHRTVFLTLPALLLAIALALPAGAAARTRSCGTVSYRGSVFPVKVLSGPIRCPAAQRIVLGFMRSGEAPLHWFCARGHGAQSYAATCGRLPGYGAQSVVRAMRPR